MPSGAQYFMLALLSNFVSHYNDIVVDLESKQAYLLIQKCGTQSLLELTRRKPDKFVLISSEEFLNRGMEELTVFVREPIGRFISGLTTQMQLYEIPKTVFEHLLNNPRNFLPMFDTHTMPQFWFLLRFGIDTKLRFKIKDLSDLSQVDNTINKININPSNIFTFSDELLRKIDYAMTEDIVLYNNFKDKTISINDVIARIIKEVDYVNELEWYKKVFPYIRNINE